MKRYVLSLVLLMALSWTFVLAEPSNWAVELVETAEENQMVPQVLQSNYQDTVLRYEYVLLGLEVLEKYKVDISISDPKPFSDITGHPYETEIIKAYNAGIISGYSNGTFKPDKAISREEITSLVYALVKTINPNVALEGQNYSFYDQVNIESWAMPYVNFSYRNEIMAGTGKMGDQAIISPKGQATREQAIILLYRLALKSDLLNRSIDGVEINGQSNTDLNSFALKTNFALAEDIFKSQEKESVSIDMVTEDFVAMSYGTDSNIQVIVKDDLMELNYASTSLSGDTLNDYYLYVSRVYDTSVINNIKSQVASLNADSTYKSNVEITSGVYLNVFYDDQIKMYAIHIDDLNR